MFKFIQPWTYYLNFYMDSRLKIALCIFSSILQSVILLPAVLLIKNIFDHVIPLKNIPDLLVYTSIIIIIYFANGMISLFTRKISLKTTKVVIQRLRDEILGKIFLLPKIILTNEKKARFHTMIVQDTLRIDIMSNALLSQVIPAFFISIGLMGILVYLSPLLFFVLFFISPLVFLLGRYSSQIIKKKIREYHRHFEVFSHNTSTIMEFIDFIRIRSNEDAAIGQQKELHAELREKSYTQAWLGGVYSILNRTAIGIFGIIILCAGGYLNIKGAISIGSLLSFFATSGILKSQLLIMFNIVPQILEGNESLKTVYDVIFIDEKLPYTGKEKIDFEGEIEVNKIDFAYDHSLILKNFSLQIKSGQSISLIGPNGSGKTSLAYLLLGFFKPNSGSIFAQGISYENLDIPHLRKQIGFVNQDPYIMPGTILENLVYGLGNITKEKIDNVLELTYCNDFIMNKPGGIDFIVGANGQFLSGGEIQKIALARALLGDFKLIILDEPGNHLDEEVINAILDNFKKYRNKSSLILITHRKSIAQKMDLVVEMNKNKNE